MIGLERTFDYELIKHIATHPKIYPHIADDGSPSAEEFEPIRDEHIWYVLVKAGTRPVGVFTYVPQNFVCYEVHTCLLPEIWGTYSLQAAKMSIQWIFENTPCRRIVTNVPDYNRIALRFARQSGLREFGVNPKSYLHDGSLWDQHMLGIGKEVLCH